MKCILNGREVLYPCSHNCPLFGDCTVMFQRDTKPVVTNADRIRSMSDEELSRHLHCIGWDCHLCSEHIRLDNEPLLRMERCDENCFEHCLEWLKQPVKEDEGCTDRANL